MVVIVALAIGLALGIQAFIVKPYEIPSGSMIPTLKVGQRVLVNRLAYKFGDPSVGDIVVFHPPAGVDDNPPAGTSGMCAAQDKIHGADDKEADPDRPATYASETQPCPTATTQESDQNFIKRIVAGPGDTISIKQGHPVVNGKEVTDENFTRPCAAGGGKCNLPDQITIPPDHYFMMGDNRGNSEDSRYWGPLPKDWIIGKAFFTYWPLDRIGLL
jgi:signal peptidase I